MKKVFLLAFLVLIFSNFVFAAAPRTINFQGRLINNDGSPINGIRNIKIELYTSPIGGPFIWEDTFVTALDSQGVFNIIMGSGTPLNIDFNQPLYVQVVYGSEIFSPRQPLSSTPHSFTAISAESANYSTLSGTATIAGYSTLSGTASSLSCEAIKISFDKIGIGTVTPTASLEVKGTVKMLGDYIEKQTGVSAALVGPFQAETDGYVLAVLRGSGGTTNWGYYEGYTDSSSNPTTFVAAGGFDRTNTGINSGGLTMPVKKGNYWKVVPGSFAGSYIFKVYWVPLGQ